MAMRLSHILLYISRRDHTDHIFGSSHDHHTLVFSGVWLNFHFCSVGIDQGKVSLLLLEVEQVELEEMVELVELDPTIICHLSFDKDSIELYIITYLYSLKCSTVY